MSFECKVWEPKNKALKCIFSNFYRYCISAFIQNFSTYFFWVLVPLIGNDMNASSTALGLLQSVSSIVYAIVTIPAGSWLSEAMRPGIPMRGAIVIFLVGGLIAMYAESVGLLFLSVICIGICNSVFWTIIIEAFGSEDKENKDRHSAIFSICHSFGKSLGYVFGGMLKGLLGTSWTFGTMMIFLGTLLIIMPLGMLPEKAKEKKEQKLAARSASQTPKPEQEHEPPKEGNHEHDHGHGDVVVVRCESPVAPIAQHDAEITIVAKPTPQHATPEAPSPSYSPSPCNSTSPSPALMNSPSPAPGQHPHQGSQKRGMEHSHRLFMYLGWMMNFAGYAVPVTIGNQFIKLISDKNIHFPIGEKPTEMFLGIFMAVIYFTQMCVSFTCSMWKGWRHKRWLIYGDEVLAAIACVIVAEVTNPYALMVGAVLLGLFVGLSNLSSMSYSIEGGGSSVGIHELVLTIGGIVLPPVCGVVVTATEDLRAPYYICFGLIVFTLVAQECFAEGYLWWVLKHNERDGRVMLHALFGHQHIVSGFAPVLPSATPSVTPSPRASMELSNGPSVSLEEANKGPSIPLEEVGKLGFDEEVTIVDVEPVNS